MSIVCFRFCQTLFNWLACWFKQVFFYATKSSVLNLEIKSESISFSSSSATFKSSNFGKFRANKKDSSLDGSFLLAWWQWWDLLYSCIFLSVLLGSIFVIARTKARSNPILTDFKRSEIYQSKLDENGLLLDFIFHFYTPLTWVSPTLFHKGRG